MYYHFLVTIEDHGFPCYNNGEKYFSEMSYIHQTEMAEHLLVVMSRGLSNLLCSVLVLAFNYDNLLCII